MIEKFDDYEGTQFLNEEGIFVFEITAAELKEGKDYPYIEFTCKSDAGTTTLMKSLSPKARWSYNRLIKACKGANRPTELDYETYHTNLIGDKFLGTVEAQSYTKIVKQPKDDGTFEESEQKKISYKIVNEEQLKEDGAPFDIGL